MALKFYASVRLDIRRIESIKQGDATVGNWSRVTVKKNKVAPPSALPSLTSCTTKASARSATSGPWRGRRSRRQAWRIL